MLALWVDLAPLIFASAVLPLQTVLTLGLVRSSIPAAFAWVAGMTMVRLLQGVLFSFVLSSSMKHSESGSPRFIMGSILFLLAVLLYVKAFRKALNAEDEDAPPPDWITKAASMSPLTAFGAGAGYMTLSAKFLVFTLGAIGVITEAQLNAMNSLVVFVLFVLLAEVPPLTILGLSLSSSSRSSAVLEGFNAWLRRNSRAITILFGLIFGTWFLIKALKQLRVF